MESVSKNEANEYSLSPEDNPACDLTSGSERCPSNDLKESPNPENDLDSTSSREDGDGESFSEQNQDQSQGSVGCDPMVSEKTCSTDMHATPSSPIDGARESEENLGDLEIRHSNTPNEGDATSIGENDRKELSKNLRNLLSQLEDYCTQTTENELSSPRVMDKDWVGTLQGTSPNHQNNVEFPAQLMTGLQAAITAWLEKENGNALEKDIFAYIKDLEEGEYQIMRITSFGHFLESLSTPIMNVMGNQDGAITPQGNPDIILQLEEYWLKHEKGIMLSALEKYVAKMKETKDLAIVHDDDDMPGVDNLLAQLQRHCSQDDEGIMLSALAKYVIEMKEKKGLAIVHNDGNMPDTGNLSSQLYESWAQKDNTSSVMESLSNFKAKTKNGQVGPNVTFQDEDGDDNIQMRKGRNRIKFQLPPDLEGGEVLNGNRTRSSQPSSLGPLAPLDFHSTLVPHTPMPSTKNRSQNLELSRRNSMCGGGKEKTSPAKVFHATWWIIYVINVVVYVGVVFLTPQDGPGNHGWPGLAAGIPICVLLLTTTILITDITTDFVCIGIAMMSPSINKMMIGDVSSCPVTPGRQTQYLVVYCLKSSEKEDIETTLMALQCSWRMNQAYGGNATYLILSGTQAPDLVECERNGIKEWNAEHAEEGGKVRYIRRCRSILFKYGQYLDLLMLINGHKEPVLFPDMKSNHSSGEVFDPTDAKNVEHLYGSDYEYIVLCDRDNVLSYNFFHIATNFFAEHPDIEILQPAITPFPEEFRKGEEGDSCYSMLSTLFQKLGLGLQRYKRVFIPSAAFYGKGIIRRSVYNRTLLGYDPKTGTTNEEKRIPRDLLSHDIIESSIMLTMMAPELAIYEEFPLTHLEWSIRAHRWDLGDLIVSKYLYPFSFGLIPNVLSKFTFHSVTPFYEDFFRNNSAAVYSSTYNLRCVLIKPIVLLTMLAYILAKLSTFGIFLLSCFINVEVLLIPLAVQLSAVRNMRKRTIIMLTFQTSYMGIVDIYYGTFRSMRAFWRILMQSNKWKTFKALNNTPFETGYTFALNCYVELGIALVVLAVLVYFRWGDFSVKDITFMLFLGLILTFPFYAGLTAMTIGGRSKIVDDMSIEDPTLRAMGEMMRKKETAVASPISSTATEASNCPTPS